MTLSRSHTGGSDVVKNAPSAPDRVYAWLRDGIINGSLSEGSFLDEIWVAESVGTSRTPVREAFHRLNAEHLIDLQPRKGAQVRVVTAKEMAEVNATRYLIESHAAAALCADRIGIPPEMAEVLDQTAEDDGVSNLYRTAELNRDFHRSIVSGHGNNVLMNLYDTLRARQLASILRALKSHPENVEVINRDHREIAAALAACDGPTATALLGKHHDAYPVIIPNR